MVVNHGTYGCTEAEAQEHGVAQKRFLLLLNTVLVLLCLSEECCASALSLKPCDLDAAI